MNRCPHNPCAFTTSSYFGLRRHISTCKYRQLGKPRKELLKTTAPTHEGLVQNRNATEINCEIAREVEEEEIVNSSTPMDDPCFLQDQDVGDNENVDKSISETILFDALESLAAITKISGAKKVNKLLKLFSNKHFRFDMFVQKAPTVDVLYRSLEDKFHGDVHAAGFETKVIQPGVSTETSYRFYKKDILQILSQQLRLASEKDIFLRPVSHDNGNVARHPMETKHFQELYDNCRVATMSSKDRGVFWVEQRQHDGTGFAGFIQLYTDKTSMTLSSNAMTAYPVHAVLMNVSSEARKKLITDGHTLTGFLPVTSASDLDDQLIEIEDDDGIVPLEMPIARTDCNTGRTYKMEILHEALHDILHPLSKAACTGFEVRPSTGGIWTCYPRIVSYCCDIPESKDISCVKHGILTLSPCVRCMIPRSRLLETCEHGHRSLHDTVAARNSRQNEEQMNNLSITPMKSCLEKLVSECPGLIYDFYSIFTFESLHNMHLGISKQLKNCLFNSFTMENEVKVILQNRTRKCPLYSIRVQALRSINSLLSYWEQEYPASGLHIDFSKKELSSTLNGLFLRDGLRGMLEGKNFRALDMVFPFVCAFLDSHIVDENKSKRFELTVLNTLYTDIMVEVMYDRNKTGWDELAISNLERSIKKFKNMLSSMYATDTGTGVKTLKFHLLNHMADDIRKYACLSMLDASPFEHYNTTIKDAYRQTSQRVSTRMDETVSRMNMSYKYDEKESNGEKTTSVKSNRITRLNTVGSFLVRDGLSVPLFVLRRMARDNINGCDSYVSNREVLLYVTQMFTITRLKIFLSLMDELILENAIDESTCTISLQFVKSGFVKGGFVPVLSDFDPATISILYEEKRDYQLVQQRIFATPTFGASKKKMNSFVLLRGEADGLEQIWIAKALSLLHLEYTNGSGEYIYLQYMQCIPPDFEVDSILGCICLKWATADDDNYSEGMTYSSRGRELVQAGEWYGIEPISSIIGTVHVIRSNPALKPFTSEMPWTEHRFYVNRFYRDFNVSSSNTDD